MDRRKFLKSCILIGSGVMGTNWFYTLWKKTADKKEVAILPDPNPLWRGELGMYDGVTFHTQPYQEVWLDALDSDKRFVAINKGRKMGRSHYETILKKTNRYHSQSPGTKKRFAKRHHKNFRNTKSFRV